MSNFGPVIRSFGENHITKIVQNNRFFSNRDDENEPNMIRIGPLLRKLVFWGAHTIFSGSRPKVGSNIKVV